MRRYFFDFAGDGQTLHDFDGRDFATAAEAHDHASLLVIQMQYDPTVDYAGWKVLVRDSLGKIIETAKVPPLDVQVFNDPCQSPRTWRSVVRENRTRCPRMLSVFRSAAQRFVPAAPIHDGLENLPFTLAA